MKVIKALKDVIDENVTIDMRSSPPYRSHVGGTAGYGTDRDR